MSTIYPRHAPRLLATLGLSLFVIHPLAGALIRGPYLQMATSNSIVVRWRTDQATASHLRFGLASTNLEWGVTDPTPVLDHSITATNLAANTTYFYSVGSENGALAWGAELHFTTHPTIPRSTRIWAIGDSGTASVGSSAPEAVRNGYRSFAGERPADVWLMLGDNAYYSGTDEEYQAAVFDVYQEMLRTTALWSTIGNHETYAPDPLGKIAYFDIFSLPQDGSAGGVPSGSEHYYSFTYGDVHFVCLDSELSAATATSPMVLWLQEDLAANTSDWLIAYWHSPPYSRGSHNSDVEGNLVKMRESIVPVLESYGVDLVLCGHSHSYERSFLLDGHYGVSSSLSSSMIQDAGSGRPGYPAAYLKAADSRARGAVYVVAGNAGQTSGGPLDHPAMYISLNRLGSMVIDVETNRLEAKFVRETGEVDDYFSIYKGPVAPIIITQPITQTVYAGDNVQLTVHATGTSPLSYQWRFNESSIPGATNKTLSLDPVQPSHGGVYSVLVANAHGVATSSNAVLTVRPARPRATWDLSRDFSVISNPSGDWSYGYKTELDGTFGLNTVLQAGGSGNGVPLAVWSYQPNALPQVFFNPTTNTATTGSGVYPPGSLWLHAGFDGAPQNFGAIRLTVPPGAAGDYLLESTARTYLEPPSAGDTDFHVVHNGQELFGQSMAGGARTGYTNRVTLAAGDVLDFLVGRGSDNRVYASGLVIGARLYLEQPEQVVFDSSSDYSAAANPNGAWSYGWATGLGGPFNLLSTRHTTITPEGAVIQSWQLGDSLPPAVHFNSSSNTATSDGGQAVYPPGTLWIAPGLDARAENFGVLRFTVPSDGGGTYRLDTTARTYLDGPSSGDSDFHVLRNGTELYAQFLPGNSGTTYSNALRLAGGDTVDLMVGRGTDGMLFASGLKVHAVLQLVVPNHAPIITNQSFALEENATSSFTLVASDADGDALSYHFTQPSVGTLAGTGPGLLYTPPANFRGSASFTVRVNDGLVDSLPATVTLKIGPQACAIPGLTSWWRLESDAGDTSGTNSGVVNGAATFGPGEVGNAMVFDGVNDSVRVPRSATLHVGAGDGFTAELWAKPDTTGIQPLLEWNNNGSIGVYLWIGASGAGALDANLIDSGGTEHALNAPLGTVSAGVWQHFALTYSRTNSRGTLYRNGVKVLERSVGSFTPQTSWDLWFGVRAPYRFKGMMDEVSLYSRALTATEIQDIFEAGSQGKCAEPEPPQIVEQPADALVLMGGTTSFRVQARGTAPLTYQWRHGNTPLAGAANEVLTLTNVQSSQAGAYSVVVSNPIGAITSAVARLTVAAQIFDVEADFSSVANPGPHWSYGWQSTIGGPFSPLTHRFTTVANNGVVMTAWAFAPGDYPVVYHNPSTNTALTSGGVYPPKATWFHPGFENTPRNFGVIRLTIPPGLDGVYALESSVMAHLNDSTSGDCDYHVAHNGVELFGQFLPPRTGTNFSTTLAASAGDTVDFLIGRGMDGILYGSGLKLHATLVPFATNIPPSITAQPQGVTATAGESVTLSVRATGSPPLLYQWAKQDDAIPGATNSTLVLQNLQLSDNGGYRVVVSNPYGAVTSAVALVHVSPAPTVVRVSPGTARSGGPVTVFIEVQANGLENALGFGLEFNPNLWTFSEAELPGTLPQGSSLVVNTNDVASGAVGLAVALPSGQPLSPQLQRLLVLTFQARPLASDGAATLNFGDRPTARQVASTLAEPLSANYVSGTITLTRADFEADTAPRPNGDGTVGITDWVQVGRFVAGLDTVSSNEFQRADCAPRATLGNGILSVGDWVQAGRYAVGLDSLMAAGGPSVESTPGEGGGGGGGLPTTRRLLIASSEAFPGSEIDLAVSLDSQGNENAIGFSISFDASRVRFLNASKSPRLPTAATLLVNSNIAGTGKLGIALGMPIGVPLPEAAGEILRLRFSSQAGAQGSVNMLVADTPVHREVVDTTATSLPCDYLPGVITFSSTAQPRLSVRRSGGSIVLAWPASAAGFALQSADNIRSDTWSRVQVEPFELEGQKIVVVPLQTGQQWFRLVKP